MHVRAARAGTGGCGRHRPPLPRGRCRRPTVVAAAAQAPLPLPLPEQQPNIDENPYGEYAWVRRAARRDPSSLLPYLSAENAFAAVVAAAAPAVAAGGGAALPPQPPPPSDTTTPEALAAELGEWALSAAVGGLEEDKAISPSSITLPDAPPLASASGAGGAGGRAPLRGKRARRALLPAAVGDGCARRVFGGGGGDGDKGLLPRVRDAALSPCGRFLALLLLPPLPPEGRKAGAPPLSSRPPSSSSSSSSSSLGVLVLSAESGAALAEWPCSSRRRPLDAPVEWASPGWSGGAGGDQEEQALLFFLAAAGRGGGGEEGLAVTGLRVGGGAAPLSSSSSAALLSLPSARTRGWARAALVRPAETAVGGPPQGPLLAVGWAPDGAPAGAYLVVLPPPPTMPAAAAAAAAAAARRASSPRGDGGESEEEEEQGAESLAGLSAWAEGHEDGENEAYGPASDDRRVAVSIWGGGGSSGGGGPLWAVARRWGGAGGGGGPSGLFLGRVSPRAPHWAPWAPLDLPTGLNGGGYGAATGERLVAVFLPPPPPPNPEEEEGAGGAARRTRAADPDPPPYLIALSVRPLPFPDGLSSELVARRLDIVRRSDDAFALEPRAEARAGPGLLLLADAPPSAEKAPSLAAALLGCSDPLAWQPAGADAWSLANVMWDADREEVRADASAMGCPPRRLALSLAVAGSGSSGANASSSPRARVLAATATPRWWAESSAALAWPRLWRTVAPGADGACVPVTVLLALLPPQSPSSSSSSASAAARGRGAATAPPYPLLLMAYGAYGAREPEGLSFDPAHEALCRRGWAVAVAHVRGGAGAGGARLPPPRAGGSGSGSSWREAGRTAARKHLGAEDVLSAAHHLVEQGVADPRRICLSAQSAGAWVVVPAAAAVAAAATVAAPASSSALTFRALLLTVPALCPLDEARAQRIEEEEDEDRAKLSSPAVAAAASDAAELFVGGGDGDSSAWDPYASCCARLATSDEPRVLLRTALDDRFVGFWEALCFAARLRRLRLRGGGGESGAAAAAPPSSSSSSVLLRTLPRGGHAAFSSSSAGGGEEILALMFLLASVL